MCVMQSCCAIPTQGIHIYVDVSVTYVHLHSEAGDVYQASNANVTLARPPQEASIRFNTQARTESSAT